MSADMKMPEIRFKGFNDEWEEKKIKDIVANLSGGASIAPTDYQNSGMRTIPKGAVNDTGTADLSGCKCVSIDYYERNILSKTSSGDLVTSLRDLVPSAPNMGRMVKIRAPREDFLMPQGVYKIELKNEVDENFVIAYTNSEKFRSFISREKNGSTQVHIRNGEYLNIEITKPKSKEQTAIGNYFQKLDSLINQHQQKHDKLSNIKKAMLEKMFPKQGETIPEIRFKGFSGDWEEKELGELAEIVRGASPRPIEDPKWFDRNSNVGWLRIKDVTEQDGRIHHLLQRISKLGQEKTRVLREKHLLLSIAASVGKPVVNYVETGVHDGFLIFQKPLFDLEFMYQWLKSFEPKWQQYGQPGSQVNLNSDIVKSQIVTIPSNEEQLKIGNYFQKLDTLINQHQQQITKLNNIKQACLSKMFV
mgnify:CR=1 FL=1